MLKGFEDITFELDEYEKALLLPVIVLKIKNNIGIEKAVTNKKMLEYLKGRGFEKVTDARIRKIISYIRINQIVPGLMAYSKGYYVTTDPNEIVGYIHSLRGRINAIWAIEQSFIDYLETLSS